MSKTVLITGTSSGFGRETAELLAAQGHRVFASMRDIAGRSRAAAEALRAKGIHVVEFDVTDAPAVEAAVAAIVAEAGAIDVLVNNAGLFSMGVTEAFTPAQARAMFDVNVFGTLAATRAVLPHMRARRDGLVVTLGSVVGRVTFPFMGLYGASKFALEALTDSLRYELSQLGVDIVLIQPSAYPTNIFAAAQSPADAARAAEYGALARVPEQMGAAFAAMFAGPDAPHPREVAVAIANVIAQPKGTRPDRVVVGNSFGADALNEAARTVQDQALAGLGLSALATLKV